MLLPIECQLLIIGNDSSCQILSQVLKNKFPDKPLKVVKDYEAGAAYLSIQKKTLIFAKPKIKECSLFDWVKSQSGKDFHWVVLAETLGDLPSTFEFGGSGYLKCPVKEEQVEAVLECLCRKIAGWNQAFPVCTQTIFINHVSDFVVEFPDDVFFECDETGIDTSDLQAAFGTPEVFFETCELVATSFDDQYFDVVTDACYKVVRTWNVINWCTVGNDIGQELVELSEADLGIDLNGNGLDTQQNNPLNNNGVIVGRSHRTFKEDALNPDGYLTYQQVIKVNDTVAPEFVNCEVPDVCITGEDCFTALLLPTPDVLDCSAELTITVNGDLGSNLNVSDVAPGTYNVVYTATDNCGNSNACATTVAVTDCKLPTPYCKDGLVLEINNTAPNTVDVWAADFDEGSFDNCQVTCVAFSADCTDTQRIFDCNQLGENLIQLWVSDGINWDFCETFVIVQDNQNVCETGDLLIAGNIQTEENEGVDLVEVTMNGGNWQDNMPTDNTGLFAFDGLPSSSDYTVTPLRDDNHLNGVSTFDLVKISKHILNIEALDSPYKMIAADANNSGSITTLDLVHIRKLILLIDTEFSNNTSWRFVDADYIFPNPSNPWAEAFPEVINWNNLTVSDLESDFVGVKIGDVNGSVTSNQLLAADDRGFEDALVLKTQNRKIQTGERFTVDFYATDFNHSGYQFTLDFGSLKFLQLNDGIAKTENFGFSLLEENVITASWSQANPLIVDDKTILFSIEFEATNAAMLSDLLSINSQFTIAEAYTANQELQKVNLEFGSQVMHADFELYQNRPNPFSDKTTIAFYLPEAGVATLEISDLNGRMLTRIEGDYAQGFQEITLDKDALDATGVLYYQLKTAKYSATKRMVLVK